MDARTAALTAMLLHPTLTVDEARREARALTRVSRPAPRPAGPRRVERPTPRAVGAR